MARDHGLGAIATKKSFAFVRALSCGIPSETFPYGSHEIRVLFHYLFYKHFIKLPFEFLTQRNAFRVNAME